MGGINLSEISKEQFRLKHRSYVMVSVLISCSVNKQKVQYKFSSSFNLVTVKLLLDILRRGREPKFFGVKICPQKKCHS